MLVQVIHVLEHALLPAHDHVVDRAQVLRVLGQPHAAAVRHDGHVELGGHQQDGDDFVDAAQPARVDLADVDGAGLQELLEHDAVLAHFARGHADVVGGQGGADGFVAEDWKRLLVTIQAWKAAWKASTYHHQDSSAPR